MATSFKNTIEEATPKRISQDLVNICWDPFGVDDFDLNGYVDKICIDY